MFDRYLAIDWSAAAVPTVGPNSIWIGDCRSDSEVTASNPSTREAAIAEVDAAIEGLRDGDRLLVGFDFAFGYPAGSHGMPGGGAWDAVWRHLGDAVEDDPTNANNRFEVGARLNAAFEGDGPFWGYANPHDGRFQGLSATKPDYAASGIAERRHVETLVPRAQPTWKLAYPGSVGSQALTGIARLQRLRTRHDGVRIWPFETGFADGLDARVVVCEIYPSLYPIAKAHATLDQSQVRAVVEDFRRHDRDDRLADMLGGPSDPDVRRIALSHEGWIYGVGDSVLPQ